MSVKRQEVSLDRRQQILEAAMLCFGKRGFHQTSMHDISTAAGISVGLIYRYFKNKEEVIGALAEEHKKHIAELIARAGEAPTLLEAMEILFTSHCGEQSPQIISAFVLDLFAEASRNPQVAKVVRNVAKAKTDGVADLIARSPEARLIPRGLDPREIAEMIFAVNDGTMMRNIFRTDGTSGTRQRERQLNVARILWRLLFHRTTHANGH
ncbi:MAG: TetR/AcrR family transcriptional regulator [Verrucomicrobiota bacterium]|nr:TetR/AcrR family transcriptional regulator [Verrucomicrobiota bacterium]